MSWLIIPTLFNGAAWVSWWGNTDRADGVLMHLTYTALLLAGFVWIRSAFDMQRRFGRDVLIGGSFLALTNILQQLGLMGIPGEGAFSGVTATLYGGTLGNRGYMGGALALLLPVVVATVWRFRFQLWSWLAVTLITWAWAGSFTRGAWLAGALGLIWLALWQRKQVPWQAWGAVALGITLCVVTAEIRGMGRSFSIPGAAPGTAVQAQAIADSSGRKMLWNSALYGIQQRPFWGWGTPALWQAINARSGREVLAENGTTDVVEITRLNSQEKEAPRFIVTHSNGRREMIILGINKVHNEYLDYALTYGIPAALLFITLLGWAIWSGRTSVPGVSAGLVAYAVYLMTWPEVIRFAPIAWFMMGLALASQVTRRSTVQT